MGLRNGIGKKDVARGVHPFMPGQRADLAMWFCHSAPWRVSHYMGKIIVDLRR